MRPSDTVYRGDRLVGLAGEVLGVRVVRRDAAGEHPLTLPPALTVPSNRPYKFEWGYTGLAPSQLALALVLDAVGDQYTATLCYHWFMRAAVVNWGDRWELPVGHILLLVAQWECEKDLRPPARSCSVCGCTDADCSQCVAATGTPCSWVPGYPDLCSRCYAEMGVTKGGAA